MEEENVMMIDMHLVLLLLQFYLSTYLRGFDRQDLGNYNLPLHILVRV